MTDGAKEYRKLHWGVRGKGKVSRTGIPDPDAEPLVELGTLVRIEYLTKKGSEKRAAIYFHDFEGSKPRLVVNADGDLLIAGGSYRVKREGIVG